MKTPTGEIKIESDVVLSAVGISTNLENIGLEDVGIKTDKGKVIVDDFYRTNVPGVYAIGDIVKGPALAHVASAEGIICVEKIAVRIPSRSITTTFPDVRIARRKLRQLALPKNKPKKPGTRSRLENFHSPPRAKPRRRELRMAS